MMFSLLIDRWPQQGLRLGAVLAAMTLSACTSPLTRAPAAPERPWQGSLPSAESSASETSPQALGFSVPAIPVSPTFAPGVQIDPQQALGLVQLIDIAQRENPDTRQAWDRARQAALTVGLVEATFLPMISASVVGGRQSTRVPVDLMFFGNRNVNTEVTGITPAVTLGWLLFDFGERNALLEGAEQLSFASNVLFNASHQKVIRDVTDQYHQYTTARRRSGLAAEALHNHKQVEQAVSERVRAGLATTVELAIARQAVAQARLFQVTSQGLEKTVYLALLRAVGLPPNQALNVADPVDQPLPAPADPLTEARLLQAMSQRPDVVAAYAGVKAAEAGVRAAEAEFMPKVFLGAVAAKNHNHFDVRGLPTLSAQATTRGVLLGVTVPLYDGGLRRTQLKQAEIRVSQAEQALKTLQQDAVREMVAAETVLHSALQSHQTAEDLVTTAQTAYDAAFEAYREGVGTITLATEAATKLLEAKQARVDARSASQLAAANLAFVMGAMITPRDQWLPVVTP